MERLYNLQTGVLASSTSASAVNLLLTPDSALPAVGTYRIIVESEIMVVSGRSGDTLTVQRGAEGTVATTHAADTVCYVIASAGGLTAVREQSVDHTHALLHKDAGGGARYDLTLDLGLLTGSRKLIAPDKDGVLATLADLGNVGLTPATPTVLGGIKVGAGLTVDPLGLLATKVQSVNGQDGGAVVLAAGDVGAVPEAAVDAYGGVAGLGELVADTPQDRFEGGRISIYQLPLGAAQAYGAWNPNTNTGGDYYNSDGHTYSISLYDGGQAKFTYLTDEFQVEVPGWIFRVSATATATLDGYTSFDEGDIIMSLHGQWRKLYSVADRAAADSAVGVANAAVAAASDANVTAGEALAAANSQPVAEVTDADTDYTLTAGANRGQVFVDRTTGIDVVVPLHATDPALGTGYTITVHQLGAGAATLVPEVGVTVGGKTATTGAGDRLTLVQRSADLWYGY